MSRIALIATHAHPLPSPRFTGDSQVILDLCIALAQLGHEVTLFAPKGTTPPDGVQLVSLPQGEHFEMYARDMIGAADVDDLPDVIHDFTIGKAAHRYCLEHGFPSVSTLLGGSAYAPLPNTVVWSEAMRGRVLRGATDYAETATPDKGGEPCEPFNEVRVVHGGVDTSFYSPGPPEEVGSHFLWLSRWSPEKGPMQAIELAKATGIELVVSGLPPEVLPSAEARVAVECMLAAQELPNVRIEWLPPGPGHHEAKREQYRRAAKFLAPLQFQEPFGLGLVESMACGTPVLAYDMGSADEIVGYSCSNFADMIACVVGGSGIPDRYWHRQRAVELFDRSVMARNYVALYEEVLNGKGWG